MPDRFNVQAGDWDTDANWSATTGGAGGASYPQAGDDAICDDNSGNCTLDANAACDALIIGQVGALYTGTLDAGSSDVDIGSGGLDCSYGGSATLDLGSGTWTVAGDFYLHGIGTFDAGTASVVLAGVGKTARNYLWLYSLEIQADASYTWSGTGAATNNLVVDGTFSIAAGNTCASYGTCSVGDNGVLAGSGVFYPGGSGISSMTGRITVAEMWVRCEAIGGIPSAVYESAAVLVYSLSDGKTWSPTAGTYTFTGDFEFRAYYAGNTLTISNANNPDWVFQGDFQTPGVFSGLGAWTPGTGTITASGSSDREWDFNGLSVEAIVIDTTGGAKVTLTGNVTTESLTGTAGELDVNGQTVTSSGAVTFASGFVVSALDGSTINAGTTFSVNGQAGLNAGATWYLNCTASGTITNATIANCDASGGVEVDATDNCVDGGGNTNINFGGVNRRRRLLLACGA